MVKNSRSLLTVLLLVSPLLFAKDKVFPKLIVNARYVVITDDLGRLQTDTRLMPSDRRAMADVETALQKWGRYTLAHRLEDADLVIVVRKGRYAEALAGVRIHGGSGEPGASIHPDVQGDAGDPQDMIAVYDASHGVDSSALWRSRQRDGLKPPDMELIKELRTTVENAAKQP